jgi:hypothetical protein
MCEWLNLRLSDDKTIAHIHIQCGAPDCSESKNLTLQQLFAIIQMLERAYAEMNTERPSNLSRLPAQSTVEDPPWRVASLRTGLLFDFDHPAYGSINITLTNDQALKMMDTLIHELEADIYSQDSRKN